MNPLGSSSVVAGGLSKVLRMQLLHALRTPRRRFYFLFPKVGGVDYGGFVADEAHRAKARKRELGSLMTVMSACMGRHVRASSEARAVTPAR